MPKATTWTTKQQLFLQWLATPKADRTPKTRDEFAAELALDRRTLTRWEHLPGFMNAVYEEAGIVLDARMPQILARVGSSAEEGNVELIKLALELRGRWTPTANINANLSPADTLAATFAGYTGAAGFDSAADAELQDWENGRRNS